tara:strand:- start:88 stop:2061 length:1974 start_codon:yes stop_codon:yes gene_type:complete
MRDKITEIINLIKVKKFKEAQIKCDDIKIHFDKNVEFLHIYGFVFFNLSNYEKAIVQWEKAIKIDPKFVDGLNNLGNALYRIGKFDEAINYLNKALDLRPNFFETYYTLSDIFYKKGMYDSSLKNINEAINLRPDHLPTIKSKLEILLKMNMKKECLKFLEKVIPYHPKETELYFKKAQVFSELGMNTSSINTYKTILMIDPEYPFVLGNVVEDKLLNCDWDTLDRDLNDLKNKIFEEKKIASPMLLSTLFDSPEILFKASKIWIKQFDLNDQIETKISKKNTKINIGYFSADFRDHPVGHLIAKMLESHDKSKYKIYGFYLGKKHEENDIFHLRIKKAFTKFYDVSNMSNEEIISLSKTLKIHIAVDLMAHTGGHEQRFGIFQNKSAPIQINFLGYPGTSGSDQIDYIIADKTVIPEKNKKFFSEKIIYLPHSYQPSEKDRILSKKNYTKKILNLPKDDFIFCCFNTIKKILPNIVNLWAEILYQVPKSVLWLLSDNDDAIQNLKIEFKKKKIDPKRIIFGTKVPITEHLARIKFADLFLDTFPYNAHTSCSDSIWAGLPILTLEGDSFQSRVASSLLKTTGLNELISKNEKEYVDKAVHIAKNKEYLNQLKNKLLTSKDSNPLFDSKSFAHNIEKAFNIVFEKHINEKDPEDIYL